MLTYTLTHPHTYSNTHTHTQTQMHTCKQTHAHTHTHIPVQCLSLLPDLCYLSANNCHCPKCPWLKEEEISINKCMKFSSISLQNQLINLLTITGHSSLYSSKHQTDLVTAFLLDHIYNLSFCVGKRVQFTWTWGDLLPIGELRQFSEFCGVCMH